MAATSSSTDALGPLLGVGCLLRDQFGFLLRALGLHQLFGGCGLPRLHRLQVLLFFLLGIGQIALRPIGLFARRCCLRA